MTLYEAQTGTLIERSMNDLIAMKAIASKLVEETRREDTCSARIESVLASDPALSAKVLRVVNSPYYGLSRRVKSLSQAIIILGVQQIRNLAIGVLAYTSMNTRDPRVLQEAKDIWIHSLETALAAQLVAESMGLEPDSRDDAFLIGLLHEVGRMFMLTQFTGPYLNLLTEGKIEDEDAMVSTFGATSHQAGALLLNRWKFPDEICRAVNGMGSPLDPSPILRAALAAHELIRDLDAVLPKAAADAGLDAREVAGIRTTVQKTAEEAGAMYGIASGY